MRKITGMTIHLDQYDPLVDVDTALLQLREELQAQGRGRTLAALTSVLGEVDRMREQMDLERPLIALSSGAKEWNVVAANWTTGVLTIEPRQD